MALIYHTRISNFVWRILILFFRLCCKCGIVPPEAEKKKSVSVRVIFLLLLNNQSLGLESFGQSSNIFNSSPHHRQVDDIRHKYLIFDPTAARGLVGNVDCIPSTNTRKPQREFERKSEKGKWQTLTTIRVPINTIYLDIYISIFRGQAHKSYTLQTI